MFKNRWLLAGQVRPWPRSSRALLVFIVLNVVGGTQVSCQGLCCSDRGVTLRWQGMSSSVYRLESDLNRRKKTQQQPGNGILQNIRQESVHCWLTRTPPGGSCTFGGGGLPGQHRSRNNGGLEGEPSQPSRQQCTGVLPSAGQHEPGRNRLSKEDDDDPYKTDQGATD